MSELPILFTPVQAARILQISRSGIYNLLKGGQLQSVKIGRSRRIAKQQLDQFVTQLVGLT